MHDAKQHSHFLEIAARRAVDQAVRPAGRPAVALAEPGGRHDERGPGDAEAGALLRAWPTGCVFGLERVAVVWLGALLVLDQRLLGRHAVRLRGLQGAVRARVSGLIDKVVELQMLRLQAERLADIVLTAPEAEVAGAAPGRRRGLRSSCAGLRFRYSDTEPVVLLDGLSFVIEPGESVAIVGPSGCGKTTLLKLMLGIYAPTAGEILVGGVPLARAGPARLARHGRRGDAGRPAVRRARSPTTSASSIRAPDQARDRGTARAWPRCTTRSRPCRWATTR